MKKITKMAILLSVFSFFFLGSSAQNFFFEIGKNQTFTDTQNEAIEKIAQSTPIKSVHTIQLKTLAETITNNTLTFMLPNVEEQLVVNIDNIEVESEGVYSFHGIFPEEQGEMVFVFDGIDVFGHIEYNDRYFEVKNFEKDGIIIVEHNQIKLQTGICDSNLKGDSTPYDPNIIDSDPPSSTDGCTTKVLFFATKAAKNLIPNLNPRSIACVEMTNAAFSVSGVAGRLARVTNVLDLPFDFVENANGDDPKFDIEIFNNSLEIKSLLKQYRADIFIVFTNGTYKSTVGLTPTGSVITANILGRVDGFADPNKPGCFIQVQNNPIMCVRTFSHEVGHLFNARHFGDTGASPGQGFQFTDAGTTRQTLVHTNITSFLINRYSNPAKTFHKIATGDATHNNAANINSSFCSVSNNQNDDIFLEWVSQPMEACPNEPLNISAVISSPPPFNYTVTWAVQRDVPANFITQSTQSLNNQVVSEFKTIFPSNTKILYIQVTFVNTLTKASISKYYAIKLKQGCSTSEGLMTDIDKDAITVVPNPNDGHFKILLGDSFEGEKRIEVTDSRGKLIQSFSSFENVLDINFEKTTYEIFFIHIFHNQVHKVQKVFIVGTE